MAINKSSRYTDPTGSLSTGQLKFSGWYLRHKIFLIHIWIGIMVVFCVGTIGYSFWKWGEYLFFGYTEDQNKLLLGQVRQMQNYAAMQASYKAQNLNVGTISWFRSGQDFYDFGTIVTNPNKRWIAEISYHFIYAGGETAVTETTMLPGEKRPVAIFGHESTVYPTNVSFVIDKVTWRSINAHWIKDVENYMKPRLDFSIENFVFNEVNPSGLNVATATFDLTNRSAYSYWRPVFYLELMSGDLTVGYFHLSVDQFFAGETKKIDLSYFGDDISVTNYKIHTLVNVFDSDVYMEAKK